MNEEELNEKVILKAEKSFLKEDKKEPFIDREYVDETKRIFSLLKADVGDFENPTDRAIFDIVKDIFREIRKIKLLNLNN